MVFIDYDEIDDIPRMETGPQCTIMATDTPACSVTASRRAGECSVWRPGTGSVTICYNDVNVLYFILLGTLASLSVDRGRARGLRQGEYFA